MDRQRVMGVDACGVGWVGVALTGGQAGAYVAGRIDELVDLAGREGLIEVVAVDMPIGLPDRGHRQADVLARKAIGTLRSSVFMTPVRAALEAPDQHTASVRNRVLAGEGVSSQAFALKPKLLEVDRWVRRTGLRVVEVHPEVSFGQIAGAPLTVRKRTWAGAQLRRRLLADGGVVLADDLGEAGRRVAVEKKVHEKVSVEPRQPFGQPPQSPCSNPAPSCYGPPSRPVPPWSGPHVSSAW